ncbi:MAG: flagellar assembly protein T N-terminal domain-containing protein [Syntrophales bacterium]|nr:flagellar assembly protein T N-terminal domain-containing protein [Syntrophales bacterium]
MKRSILSFLLVSVVFFLPQTADSQDLIRAVGMATIYNNAVDVARDKALDNAQRNAVEEKVGVMVTSVSEVENFQLKMDQILSESRGFINAYKIISEGRQGSSYKVTIEAEVETGRLKDRMDAIQLVMVRKSKPRLMFILNGREKHHAIAEAAMTKDFLSHDFKVIDSSTFKKIPSFSTLSTSNQALSTVAHRYGAEIVILSHVEDAVKRFKMGDVEVTSHEVTVTNKALNGDTGEIIATANKTEKGEFKAAIEAASSKASRQIRDEILDRWSSELTNTATVKLQISGLIHDDLSALKEKLREQVKGLKQIYQRSYSRGTVELDLELKGNSQGLVEDLTAIIIRGKKIRILETTPNRIEASMASK